jgi:transcriptional regulator with XRE-family HTH domain
MPKDRAAQSMDGPQRNPIDAHVGLRIRLRRNSCGLSQKALGDALGLTFQQVQKYELGANRVGASRLFEIARVLDVPIDYFFNDMPTSTSSSPFSGPRGRMRT